MKVYSHGSVPLLAALAGVSCPMRTLWPPGTWASIDCRQDDADGFAIVHIEADRIVK
jgi:hypothetical protein